MRFFSWLAGSSNDDEGNTEIELLDEEQSNSILDMFRTGDREGLERVVYGEPQEEEPKGFWSKLFG